jgi:hypothetical protein
MKTILPLFFLMSFLISAENVKADETYTFIVKKQEEKKKTRWSLSEWLDTRDRMRMMDIWLALHSSSPYEFYLGGDYQFSKYTNAGPYTNWRAFFAAYVTIFGLEAIREFEPNRVIGLFHFRFFGYHHQNTNITLNFGIKSENNPVRFQNAILGAEMTLYVAKFFGIKGLYHHYFDSTPNGTGATLGGSRLEGGAFIDFNFLRVFGLYFSESISSSNTTLYTGDTRSGVHIGTQIYF